MVAAVGCTAPSHLEPNRIISVSILRWRGSKESGAKVREGKKRGMQRKKRKGQMPNALLPLPSPTPSKVLKGIFLSVLENP